MGFSIDGTKAVYAAFLRGINVGPAKRVAMAELRALMEELGYSEVRTLLNSGNVVVTATKGEPREAAVRIEKALQAKLAEIVRQDWGQERIALTAARSGGATRAVYMWMPEGVIGSKVNGAAGKALGEGITSRNWATILKLKEMVEKTGGQAEDFARRLPPGSWGGHLLAAEGCGRFGRRSHHSGPGPFFCGSRSAFRRVNVPSTSSMNPLTSPSALMRKVTSSGAEMKMGQRRWNVS